ncbi:6-hydroxymethylpterin diphosphokinase MptE-like protein [Haladaptatus caseinilyticus]|uniref:6-hydroxymethylpterin diphosphokinase MptE-like protein n=1 Tax=Haladaptatus caseinilyticus TaxID=2993314 RepID=UPI00224A9745|nr:6-hydroxymethylpterin diphosphokinase MptE-like protein [Haladaptatus caseinilyticus]
MNFVDWEPVYSEICRDFGFSRARDEHARDVLADLAEPFDSARFDGLSGATVAVAGAGPSLEAELDKARAANVVLAASTATDVLLTAGIGVDCMVTDLDKNPGTARKLTERGIPVVAHAHGDNIPAIRTLVPTFDTNYVLATTQAEPHGPVENFGGFTDGDRAAFLADHFGADELVFLGWDFDDPAVDEMKRRKLVWAERLLYWLEQRRDERFSVLDGRRVEIEAGWIPG